MITKKEMPYSRCIVLGASGFIGSAIARKFSTQEGIECVALHSAACDLRDRKATIQQLSPISLDALVVYAAGIPRLRGDSFETMVNNLTMVDSVIAAYQEVHPARMIFLSSVEVYGTPKKLPITEETPLEPETVYGVGKVAAELLFKRWCTKERVPLNILRLPGIYGPDDQGRGMIGTLVKSIIAGREFHLFGDGSDLRDYVFVEDVAKVVAKLAATKETQITINLATGASIAISEIIELAFAVYGSCPIIRLPRRGSMTHLQFDITKLKRVLPELTMTPVLKGLKCYSQKEYSGAD